MDVMTVDNTYGAISNAMQGNAYSATVSPDWKLKRDLFVLAGWLADGEILTGADAALSLREVVARIHSDNSVSPVALAMVAMELAHYIEGSKS